VTFSACMTTQARASFTSSYSQLTGQVIAIRETAVTNQTGIGGVLSAVKQNVVAAPYQYSELSQCLAVSPYTSCKLSILIEC